MRRPDPVEWVFIGLVVLFVASMVVLVVLIENGTIETKTQKLDRLEREIDSLRREAK